jgi:hypothetical protein
MPSYLPTRAAGQTLVVDELREAIDGMRHDDEVTVNGMTVLGVDRTSTGIDLDAGHECDATSAEAVLEQIAHGRMTKGDMVKAAKGYFNGEEVAA